MKLTKEEIESERAYLIELAKHECFSDVKERLEGLNALCDMALSSLSSQPSREAVNNFIDKACAATQMGEHGKFCESAFPDKCACGLSNALQEMHYALAALKTLPDESVGKAIKRVIEAGKVIDRITWVSRDQELYAPTMELKQAIEALTLLTSQEPT